MSLNTSSFLGNQKPCILKQAISTDATGSKKTLCQNATGTFQFTGAERIPAPRLSPRARNQNNLSVHRCQWNDFTRHNCHAKLNCYFWRDCAEGKSIYPPFPTHCTKLNKNLTHTFNNYDSGGFSLCQQRGHSSRILTAGAFKVVLFRRKTFSCDANSKFYTHTQMQSN